MYVIKTMHGEAPASARIKERVMAMPQPTLHSEIPQPTTRTVQRTFRLPRALVAVLEDEAARGGLSLSAYVKQILTGFTTYYGLPAVAAAFLEVDRRRLHMGRFEYELHLLFQRHLDIREREPGFDAPRTTPDRERGME